MEQVDNSLKDGIDDNLLSGDGEAGVETEGIQVNHMSPNNINTSDNADLSSSFIQRNFEKINQQISKIENEKIGGINSELAYLRQILEYQNSKIEKLTSIISDLVENRNHNTLIQSLQMLNESEQTGEHTQDAEADQVAEQAPVGVSVTETADNMGAHHDSLTNSTVHLDSNMDPQLHQVAAAAVQQVEEQAARAQVDGSDSDENIHKFRKKMFLKRKSDSDQPSNLDISLRDAKRPKINIDFLHNPMTVKEIYDEFTKGFRGQPPLCEMDARFGKHEWRGDSRSKESKRYQRRKKLCDAIKRGMKKYGKSAEDIISYIEEFRGDKSLTWVMNGNLPSDLCI